MEVLWSPVTTDTAGDRELATEYQVHRGADSGFAPTEATRLATVQPPPFGDPEGKIRLVDSGAAGQVRYYVVRSFNAAGRFSDSPEFSPEVCDGVDNDADGTIDDLALGPGPVGSSLRLSRESAPEAVVLEWQGADRADRYAVYRSPDAQDVFDPSRFLAETGETRYRDLPPSGAIFFYLVSSRDSCGGENSH